MGKKLKYIFLQISVFVLIISINPIGANSVKAFAIDADSSSFIKKISKSYTKKFCNSIAFGLSKESAMNFSIEENKKVFKNKKELRFIDNELLAEEIAISVVENCGYPINLSGDKGIKEFKAYYLLKDKALLD